MDSELSASQGNYATAPYNRSLTHVNGRAYLGFLLSKIWEKANPQDLQTPDTQIQHLEWIPSSLIGKITATPNPALRELRVGLTLATASTVGFSLLSKWLRTRTEASQRPVRTNSTNDCKPRGKPSGPAGYMIMNGTELKFQELTMKVGQDLIVSDCRHPTPRWCQTRDEILVMSPSDKKWDSMWKNQQLGVAINWQDVSSPAQLGVGARSSSSKRTRSAREWLAT